MNIPKMTDADLLDLAHKSDGFWNTYGRVIEAARDAQVQAALAEQEPVQIVGWLEDPFGAFRANPDFKLSGPNTLRWSIPVFMKSEPSTPAAQERMLADFPALSAFHEKYALGPMTAPSCLCCGQLPESIAIKHAELPGIVICTKCRDAAQERAEPVAPAVRERAKALWETIKILGFQNEKFALQHIEAALSATPPAPAQPAPDPSNPEQAEAPRTKLDSNMDDPNLHAYGDQYPNATEDILRDVCELEPANPDLNDTICIDISDLKIILDRHLSAALATKPQAGEQKPVAWLVYWGLGEMRPAYPAYNTRELAEQAAATIKSNTEVRPLYTHPAPSTPAAQERAEPVAPAVRERAKALWETIKILGFQNEKFALQHIEAALSATPPAPAQLNQCDGCAAGAPLNEWGNHKYPDGSLIGCTKDRYSAQPSPEPSKPDQAEAPKVGFEDSRVQTVYGILCSEEIPPGDEHWEGFAARRIVDALATKQQAVQPATPPAQTVQDSAYPSDVEIAVPPIGSQWGHTNGDTYTVTGYADMFSDSHQRHPPRIIYRSAKTGRVWSREHSDWYQSIKPLAARTRGDEAGKS